MKTFDRVQAVIVKCLCVEESKVTESASFTEDLGADSLDTYELLQGLEEEFGISIPEDQSQNFKNVGEIVKFIDSYKK